MQVWSLPTQRFQFTLSGHSNWVRSCNFSPDGRLAVSGSDDKTVRIWDLRTKRALRTYSNHSAVNAVRFHPDGTCIAAACGDSTIRIWDVRTNGLLQLYKEHGGAATGTEGVKIEHKWLMHMEVFCLISPLLDKATI